MSILISALILVAAMGTFVLFYTASYHKKRARMLEKVPVTPVGDIEEEGVVKVVGKVVALDKILTSPMTKTECVFYRLHIERQSSNDDASSSYARRKVADEDEDDFDWETVVDDVRSTPFGVEDETGTAAIEAAKIEVDVKSRKRIDSGRLKGLSESQEKMLNDRYPDKTFSYTKKMRYTEVIIEEGDEVMVTGEIELPKSENPSFCSIDDSPIHLSDQTENKAAIESLKSAKTNTIFSAVSGVCTLGLIAWLVVTLTSSKSSTSSSNANSTTPTSTGTEIAKGKNPQTGRGKQLGGDIPDIDPKIEVKDVPKFEPKVEPKIETPPKQDEPKKDLPQLRDVDSIMVRAKDKIERNDIAGISAELKTLIDIANPDDPKKPQVVEFLTSFINLPMPELNEPSRAAFLKWHGPKDVAEICDLLKSEVDLSFQRDILKKLAEWKNPQCAETVVIFLKKKDTETDAANVFKAIGPEAEKALIPCIKPPTDPATRIIAMKLLETIGSADTVAALEEIVLEKDKQIADQARDSLGKVSKRSGTVRSLESIVTALKVKALENDAAGITQAIADLKLAAKDDVKKREAAAALLDSSLVATDVAVKREMISQALMWCTKEQVPQLLAALPEAKDDVSTANILKKLKEFKDVRSAAPVAELLKDDKQRAEAVSVLKAIGGEAEAAVIPLAKPDQNAMTRVAAMDVLEMIGTKDSIAAIEGYVSDENKDVSVAANKVVTALTAKTGVTRSLDGLIASLKAKAAANDLAGARTTLKAVADAFKADHPKRSATFKSLLEASQTIQLELIKQDVFMQAIRWAGTEDVPVLAKMLTELIDDKIDSAKDQQAKALFDKFKELKDPRAADTVAIYLINPVIRDKAAEVLKEIGAPAEKAIQPYVKETGPDMKPIRWPERKFVIEVLGDMGTAASLPALQAQTRDKLVFIKDAAKAAIKKIEDRKDKK